MLGAAEPRPGVTREGRVIHVEDQLTLTRHTTATSATRPPVLLVPPLAALASAFDLPARAPPIRRHTADGDTRRLISQIAQKEFRSYQVLVAVPVRSLRATAHEDSMSILAK
jgi:hypothetical protein